ncbi:zinc finger protein [Macleaya cordata]|uniref:Zinc finger protein n=1 Tax=Macleaya cordata TaxID=56857 RepID=A0A200Q2S5_MACCD|nr:zinc finger protein [Macleaya cordata]
MKCHLCGDDDHLGKECPWEGYPCRRPGCSGWRHISTSHTEQNPGKKYLMCDKCHSFEWLCDAITKHEGTTKQEQLLSKSPSSSRMKGKPICNDVPDDDFCEEFNLKARVARCYHCNSTDHMARECPWRSIPCTGYGCNSKMRLGTSSRQWSLGQMYLKCDVCGTFAWLKDMLSA